MWDVNQYYTVIGMKVLENADGRASLLEIPLCQFVSIGNEIINSLFMEHGFALHIQSIINIIKTTVLGVIEFGAVI